MGNESCKIPLFYATYLLSRTTLFKKKILSLKSEKILTLYLIKENYKLVVAFTYVCLILNTFKKVLRSKLKYS